MAHERCTRCKEESSPRHKYKRSGVAGVYCDDCMRWITGYRRPSLGQGWLGSIWGSVWDRITDLVDSITAPFTHTHKVALKEKAAMVQVAYSAAMTKARDIPGNAQAGVPQKA